MNQNEQPPNSKVPFILAISNEIKWTILAQNESLEKLCLNLELLRTRNEEEGFVCIEDFSVQDFTMLHFSFPPCAILGTVRGIHAFSLVIAPKDKVNWKTLGSNLNEEREY